jgi:hypothetical protein
MKVDTKDGHIYVIADEGNYVGLKDLSVYGEALSLGRGKTEDDVVERPIEWWPKQEEPELPEAE